MLTIPRYIVRFGEAIWLRITIALFFYLSLSFVRLFISVGSHDHQLLTVLCATFFDASCIIIFNLLYGRHSVGRDINTLSFYGVVLHAMYLACYFLRIEFSEIHNMLSKGLNGLIILRIIFITSSELFYVISPIHHIKKFLLHRKWLASSQLNSLIVAVFALCAVPLSIMIYVINTDEMRASGIAVILFAFYVAFEKGKSESVVSVENQIVHITPKHDTEQVDLAKANEIIFELNFWLKIIFVIAVIMALGITASIKFYKVSFFDAGYASGYSDAKSGAASKREANFEKALACIEVNRNRFPSPSDAGCPASDKP
jgi:FtsH-binding integral membrane protein